jgi:hypothetical protein
MKGTRSRIKKAIKVAESTDYFGYRLSRLEELKRNHEENKDFFKEIFNRPVKIRITSNCIVSILGTLLKVPTEMAEKDKYVILRYV